MTANEYQIAALRTANKELNRAELLLDGILGMAGEAGECADIIKKHLFQGHELDKEHLIKECGDVAWYLAITAWALGYPLDDVLTKNVEKLNARYPNGVAEDLSKNRKAGDV